MIKNFKEITTKNAQETSQIGSEIIKEIKGGDIICLSGDLGAGKTTFSQGFIRGLGVEGALTSPTFVLIKEYFIKSGLFDFKKVFHIDTYRVESQDILDLGWEEMISDKNNVVLVEWPEKIRDIIPSRAIWIDFKIVDEDKRNIIFRKNE